MPEGTMNAASSSQRDETEWAEPSSSDSERRGRGRPALGPALVDHLEGPGETKKRLRVILETVTGQKSAAEACAELGLGKSRFNEVRQQVLQGALETLHAKPRGRPRKPESAEDLAARLADLEEENQRLFDEVQLANVRNEIELVFPDLVVPEDEEERKKKLRRERNRRKRQRKSRQRRRPQR
ncbi:hypothetical protein ACFL51_00565 [Myxococcota bacterium]